MGDYGKSSLLNSVFSFDFCRDLHSDGNHLTFDYMALVGVASGES